MPALCAEHFSLNETALRSKYKQTPDLPLQLSPFIISRSHCSTLSRSTVQQASKPHFREASTRPELDQNPKQTLKQDTAAAPNSKAAEAQPVQTVKCNQRNSQQISPFCTLDSESEIHLTRAACISG